MNPEGNDIILKEHKGAWIDGNENAVILDGLNLLQILDRCYSISFNNPLVELSFPKTGDS